jgi:histidinol phosphatase-like PHP family hydrolase
MPVSNDLKLNFDLHIHTCRSTCAKREMTPRAAIEAAAGRGITRLAFTDHFFTFTDPDIFNQTRADAAQALKETGLPVEVFFGCEAEAMAPGCTAGSAELAAGLDFVMVAASHFQNTGITELPPGLDDDGVAHYYLEMFTYAAGLPWANVIAHPFFVIPPVASVEVLKALSDAEILSAIEVAKENNVAVEISRRVFFPGQLDFSLRFYRLCKRGGLKFTLGSDAHDPVDAGCIEQLRPVVEELNLTEKDFWLPERKDR